MNSYSDRKILLIKSFTKLRNLKLYQFNKKLIVVKYKTKEVNLFKYKKST